jgi:hypothetical protein
VNGRAEIVEHTRLGGVCRKFVHVFRPPYTPPDNARGVVIPANKKHADTGLREVAHLADGPQPRAHVLPRPVKQVAGNNHKRHALLDGQCYEVRKGVAGRAAQHVDGRALAGLDAAHRAVKVHVGGVDELEHGFRRATASSYNQLAGV